MLRQLRKRLIITRKMKLTQKIALALCLGMINGAPTSVSATPDEGAIAEGMYLDFDTINDNISVTAAATGGIATGPDYAGAAACAEGIHAVRFNTINGNTSITATATGGTATGGINTVADTYAVGIGSDHNSDTTINGNTSITAAATGGRATTTSTSGAVWHTQALASANAYGIQCANNSSTIINGNTLIMATATGGVATTVSTTTDAHASAYGIYDKDGSLTTINGSTSITVTACGGTATYTTTVANASGNAYGIYDCNNSPTTISGDTSIRATAIGGSGGIADAIAYGVYTYYGSNVTLGRNVKITAIALAGTATSGTPTAYAYALYANDSNIYINQATSSPYIVQLTGDVEARNNANIYLALNNSSSYLRGNVLTDGSGVINLTLGNNAIWQPVYGGNIQSGYSGTYSTGVNTIAALTMNGGIVSLNWDNATRVTGRTLNIGTLSGGGGAFHLNSNLSAGLVDRIMITGAAGGNYQLVINNLGSTNNSAQAAKVVDIASGATSTATFTGDNDVGAYRYGVAQGSVLSTKFSGLDNDDYYCYNTGTPSNISKAAMAENAGTIVAWYGELNEIKKRLGDLRMGSQSSDDLWARGYADKYTVRPGGNEAYSQIMRGMEIGKDNPQGYRGGKKYTGFLLGYGQANNKYSGGSGTTDSSYVGAYASWLNDDGTYIDLIGKYNWLRHDFKMPVAGGTSVDGGLFNNQALGLSMEFGKHIEQTNGVFIEPQLELASLWSKKASYATTQNLAIEVPSSRSLQLRLGCAVGQKRTDRDGACRQVYGKVSWINEYAGDSYTVVDSAAFSSSLKGHQWVTGLGFIEDTESHQLYVDVEKSWGNTVSKEWGVNVGYRLKI